MTDKQIIKPRPICLYEDTCLFLKEKTRSCEDCVHYKNYWDELLEKEQVEKIKSLEQECEELKSNLTDLSKIIDCKNGTILTFKEQLDRLKQILTEIKEIAENVQSFVDIRLEDDVYTEMDKILQKISEVEDV